MEPADYLYHIFLPKKPPERFDQRQQHQIDAKLLQLVARFLQENYYELEEWQELDNIVSCFGTWDYVQNGGTDDIELTKRIQTAIRKLDEGQSFVFYVREQNSTVLLRPHPRSKSIILVFHFSI